MVDELCTTAQVKARIIGGPDDAVDDALILELIQQVSAWIEGYTYRHFVPEVAATYVFDTEAGFVLRIPRGIRTITSMGVAMSHQPDASGSYVTVPAADRLLRPKAGDLMSGEPPTEVRISRASTGSITRYATAENGCTITGDFGFAAVPADIQSVTIDACVSAYQNRQNGASGVIGADDMAVAPWSQFFSRGSPQRATLDRWRYPGLA
jgi:hypothetical protein